MNVRQTKVEGLKSRENTELVSIRSNKEHTKETVRLACGLPDQKSGDTKLRYLKKKENNRWYNLIFIIMAVG